MIKPAKGYAFIIEEKTSNVKEGSKLKEMGFDAGEKNLGVVGTIYAVANTKGILRHWWDLLFASENLTNFKAGQRVVFSRYVTEDTYVEDEEGNQIENMQVVPLHAIIATI